MKNSSGDKPQDSLSCLYNIIKGTGYIIANEKGVVIKEFVMEALKLLPFLVLPISTLYFWVW